MTLNVICTARVAIIFNSRQRGQKAVEVKITQCVNFSKK